MNPEYYVLIDDAQSGPYTIQQIESMLATGKISPATSIWTEGQAEWQPLSTLNLRSASAPPPLAGVRPPPIRPTMPGMPPAPGKTEGLAIWSLILGLLTFLFSIFTAIPAVICGHLALGKIKKSGGALSGRGMAIAGLVIGYLGLTIIPVAILAAIALPAFTAVQEKATEIRSLSNAKQIGMACRQYANDNHGSFPPNLDALFPTYLPNRAVLVSPLMPADPDGYTYTDLPNPLPPILF